MRTRNGSNDVAINLDGAARRSLRGNILGSHVKAPNLNPGASDIFFFVYVSTPYLVLASLLNYSRVFVSVNCCTVSSFFFIHPVYLQRDEPDDLTVYKQDYRPGGGSDVSELTDALRCYPVTTVRQIGVSFLSLCFSVPLAVMFLSKNVLETEMWVSEQENTAYIF